jgi:UDP-N-acetylmuramoyl-tripeptide--D-alanyl-D-alanine ligase
MIRTPDGLAALQELARNHRRRFSPRMVCITGTNGKTTVKEMTAAVLSSSCRVLKNQGNLNNQYGLPLSLFHLGPEHDAAVLELGMSALGEISQLCRMAEPEIGVVTNAGQGHTLQLKDVETVARAKGELLEALPQTGLAVVNGDDPQVMAQCSRTRARVVSFGLNSGCHYRPEGVIQEPGGTAFSVMGQRISLRQLGVHNVVNCLAALAAGRELGVGLEAAARELSRLDPVPMRLEMIRAGSYMVINDCYNANPPSMRAALETVRALGHPGRKVAILGDMLELGETERQEHFEIGRLAGEVCGLTLTAGPLSENLWRGVTSAGGAGTHFDDREALASRLKNLLLPGDLVLVKASRGMHFEDIVNTIKEL